jgi:hypothetical protein
MVDDSAWVTPAGWEPAIGGGFPNQYPAINTFEVLGMLK